MKCTSCGATLAAGQTTCPVCTISETKPAHTAMHCMKCGRLLPPNATMCPVCDARQPLDPLEQPVVHTTIAAAPPRPAQVKPTQVEPLVSCPHCARLIARDLQRCPACGKEVLRHPQLVGGPAQHQAPLSVLARRVVAELWQEPVTGLARVATVLHPQRILALGVIAIVICYVVLYFAELMAANNLFHLIFRSISPSVSLVDSIYSTPPFSRNGFFVLQLLAPLLPIAALSSMLFFVRQGRPVRAEMDIFVAGVVILPASLLLLLFAGIALVFPGFFALGACLGGSISTVMLYGALHNRYHLAEKAAFGLSLLLVALTVLISSCTVVLLLRMLFSWNW